MESYETEWLTGQPVAHAIMHMVGLFDRPASGDCLKALRAKPVIKGLTEKIVMLDDGEWQRAVVRLREVRLLAPPDPAAPDALDAHPLVREWFGERLKETNQAAQEGAHGRLYEHLRDTTREGQTPTLEDLAPLYQAIAHGCLAGRHEAVREEIVLERLIRRDLIGRLVGYSLFELGAFGTHLASLSWFFDTPYEIPLEHLDDRVRGWALNEAAFCLRAQGRMTDASPTFTAGLEAQQRLARTSNVIGDLKDVAIAAVNICEIGIAVGNIDMAITSGNEAVAHADASSDYNRTAFADAINLSGRRAHAETIFAEAERMSKFIDKRRLYGYQGYRYWELLLSKGGYVDVCSRVEAVIGQSDLRRLFDDGLYFLMLGRANLSMLLTRMDNSSRAVDTDIQSLHSQFEKAIEELKRAAFSEMIPRGHLGRAAFRRSVGDWDGAARDLDEVEEIAEPGPMRLYLCDMALERARLALARSEAFAPLNGLIDDSPPKPERPSDSERKNLHDEAAKQLAIAADYITKCGYHRRDEELAELQAVLCGERTFADLPPRV
jgi:hypothetical protein